MDELLGSRCLVLLAGLGLTDFPAASAGSIVLFLDPYTLQPIRTPLLTTLSIMDCRIVRQQHSWLLLAALIYGTPEFNPKIAVWDITDVARREGPSILGTWHEAGFDCRFFDVAPNANGFDMYYLLTHHYSPNSPNLEEIWRFNWSQKKSEKLLTIPYGTVTGLTVWTA